MKGMQVRPTLRQLEYIVAVADTGRVGAAAAQLNVSQPSLSAQLAEVEADLGTALFLRGRGGARITPVGVEIVRRARLILRDHADLRAAASGTGIFQGRLRLGVLPSLGPYLLPEVVRRLHQEHPSFRLVVREESTRDLDDGLRDGRLDMIISTPEDHPGTHHTALFTEQFWVAAAMDHQISKADHPLRLADLKGQVLLSLGPKYRLSHMVGALARRAGARMSDEYEGTSLDAIRVMAATGAGIAILPQIYAATEARRGLDVSLGLLQAEGASREIALIQPAHATARPGSDTLAQFLIDEAARILSGAVPP